MYTPSHFQQRDIGQMHALITARPLATLVTLSNGGLDANHIPLHLSPSEGEFGTLRGHVARANPMWRELPPDGQALAIFHGPESYISPGWYPTKRETGEAVPTWNYAVVHARGALEVAKDSAWLSAHLESFTDARESGFPEPWAVTDAPAEFIERLVGAVVGIELVI